MAAPAHPLLPLGRAGGAAAALAPAQLSATAEAAARALLRQGESGNTRASYASAMRYWCAWYAARYGQPLHLPVPVPVVVQFIVDHAARRPDAQALQPASDDAARAGAPSSAPDDPAPANAARPAASPETQARAPSAVGAPLVCELPPTIDAALVRHGYKTRLGPPALSTLVHRLAVLSKAHQLANAGATASPDAPGEPDARVVPGGPVEASAHGPLGQDARVAAAGSAPPGPALANPCADPLVRELLARTRRAYAQRGVTPKRQRALTKDPLAQVLATCDDSVRGQRDRALLLFAWATGGRRRSEVASAALSNLRRIDADSFLYTLTHSKTNQSGEVRPQDYKPLVGSAAQAMNAWLQVLRAQGIHAGPVFRRVRRGGHVGEALTGAAVREIVRERCALAGVEGEFSAHSLRAGFVTEAGRQNLPLAETMAMTGHQSVDTVLDYFRAEAPLAGRAGRLLDE